MAAAFSLLFFIGKGFAMTSAYILIPTAASSFRLSQGVYTFTHFVNL
jgi:hypothetical protein